MRTSYGGSDRIGDANMGLTFRFVHLLHHDLLRRALGYDVDPLPIVQDQQS